MRYPVDLPENGSIGFLAPSFGCATEPYYSCFMNALKTLNEMGYGTIPGPNATKMEGIGISNTPEACAKEVMEMFAGQSDVLISCGGGELMCEILPYVDFDKLAEMHPKWFMGYSDNTNLTFLLATLTDTASIYGPCAKTLGMEPWHPSIQDALDLLCGKNRIVHSYDLWEKEDPAEELGPLAPYNVTEPVEIRSFVGEKEVTGEKLRFSGRLLGGCLDCLANLVGTKYDKVREFCEKYKGDGIIWFLEACDLNVFSIRRAMWQLREAGWFTHVKGFLIGRPANGETMMNLDHFRAVLGIIGSLNVPVIMDVDLGHLPPMMPLVEGSLAAVTVEGNELSIEMKYL
ncbi:MAG: S66 peptidase family protein [Acetatifactor sp.]